MNIIVGVIMLSLSLLLTFESGVGYAAARSVGGPLSMMFVTALLTLWVLKGFK